MTKKVVFFDALNDKAKEKAREWFNEDNECFFLEEHLINVIKEKLEDQGFEVIGRYKNGQLTGYKDLEILYSLSYCQGDGVSFKGTLSRDGVLYNVEQNDHHYYHEYTIKVYIIDPETDEESDAPDSILDLIRRACKETERAGYEEIEYQQSPEYIDEMIMDNEYTFTLEGKRMDPDKPINIVDEKQLKQSKIDELARWDQSLAAKDRQLISRSVNSIVKTLQKSNN